MTPREIADIERFLTTGEREELQRLILDDMVEHVWYPLEGPQTLAFHSQADIIGFGGAAGGGKTDLAVGKALEQHRKVMILRREATQLTGIVDRLTDLLGTRDGYNGADKIWRNAGPREVQIEFGSTPNPGDETRYQGRPHDLLVFDEGANFLEQQVRFLLGWVRSAEEGVHSQALITFNPPTSAEGRWILDFFGPWLDKKHPLYPANPGQVLYAAMIPTPQGTSRDVWQHEDGSPLSNAPFVLEGGRMVYDFNPDDYKPEDIITPQGRTFIPSRISDNPHLLGTGYLRQLQALPEPLRSQMLYGDFQAGVSDDPFQVIPTEWIEAAQARWRKPLRVGEMLTLGVDVARGGRDNTVLAPRHKQDGTEHWFGELKLEPGRDTPDGESVAGLAIAKRRDGAPILIDVIGVGSSPYDILVGAGQDVIGVNASEKALGTDRSGRLSFFNQRSEDWWRMRELLDPANNHGAALPPDPELLKELAAPRWTLSGFTIKVESREEIIDRVGRSPDRATAVILAAREAPKRAAIAAMTGRNTRDAVVNRDPVHVMHQHLTDTPAHNGRQAMDYIPGR